MITDEELFARAKQGDQRAFAELYDRREPGLFRYVLHMTGDRFMAEEAVHEAFLGMIQPGGRFDPKRGSVEAYLYGTVRNLVRVMLRSQPAEPGRELSVEPDVLVRMIGDEMTAALYEAIGKLPSAYREAVVLCDLEERSYEDAARIMECAVGTVRSRLHRARSMLTVTLRPLKASSEVAG